MADDMLPPASGTDQRLDAILAELRGLRSDLDRAPVAWRQRVDRIANDVAALGDEPQTVELREPAPAKRTTTRPTTRSG